MSRDTETPKRPKRGFTMSAEAVKKRNESRRRNNIEKYGEEYAWFSPDTVEKLREGATGQVPTKRARANMSEAQFKRNRKGRPLRHRAAIAKERRKQPPWTAEQREAASWRKKIWWEKKKKAEAKAERE